MSHDIPSVGPAFHSSQQQVEGCAAKFKTLGFALAIIFGIVGLIAASIGAGGFFHAGALNHLGHVNSIVMIVIGGGGGIPLLIVGIFGFTHTCFHAKESVKGDAIAAQKQRQKEIATSESEIKKQQVSEGIFKSFNEYVLEDCQGTPPIFCDHVLMGCPSDGTRRIWSPETGLCQQKFSSEVVSKPLLIAKKNNILMSVDATTVYVSQIVSENCEKELFQDTEACNGHRPTCIAINEKFIALATQEKALKGNRRNPKTSIKTWRYNTKESLDNFTVEGTVTHIAIQNSKLLFKYGSNVNSLDLETGHFSTSFHAENYIGICKNTIVSIDDRALVSFLTLESGECQKTFNLEIPFPTVSKKFIKMALWDDLLIGILESSGVRDVVIWSATSGTFLHKLGLSHTHDIDVIDNHLVVVGQHYSKETQTYKTKIWQFAKNNLSLKPKGSLGS